MKKICVLDFEIKLLSGMHIGGSDSSFDIGGADSPVFRDPLTKQPIIPGSSLKGKLRTLLTYKYGKIQGSDYVITDKATLNIFDSVDYKNEKPGITRALFRDMVLTDESIEKLKEVLGEGIYTEIKAENSIDKLKGTAKSPRFIERVPAGVNFKGEIVLTSFDGDDTEKLKSVIEEALQLLELNYIGGSGSRGYGRVEVVKKEWRDENL